MKMYVELLKIAQSDLRASTILYDNELYPQAIFYFQQSVEKASKSYGLLSGVITDADLKKEIGHNAFKIYTKFIEKRKEANPSVIREMGDPFLTLEELTTLKQHSLRQVDRGLINLNLIFKQPYNENHIDTHEKEIKISLKNIEYFIEDELKRIRRMTDVNIIMKIINILINVSKLHHDKLKRKMTMESIARQGMLFSVIESVLYNFSDIFRSHSTTTRYPEKERTPIKTYTKNSPIVKFLPEFIAVQNISINAMEEIVVGNPVFEANVTDRKEEVKA